VKAGDPLGTAPAITAAPTSIPQQAENTNIGGQNIQLIKATYTQREDIQPNRFSVKVGMPVRLEIDAKEDGYGCMGSMALPGLSQKIDVFSSGKTMVFDFTPSKTGNYDMTCAMGVPRGSIEVI
jgi:plastocyanin domain-containing protein